MSSPKMVGNCKGMDEAQREKIWDLHVKYNLPGTVIAARMGLGVGVVNRHLKKRRDETGVEVKIDHFRIQRPLK